MLDIPVMITLFGQSHPRQMGASNFMPTVPGRNIYQCDDPVSVYFWPCSVRLYAYYVHQRAEVGKEHSRAVVQHIFSDWVPHSITTPSFFQGTETPITAVHERKASSSARVFLIQQSFNASYSINDWVCLKSWACESSEVQLKELPGYIIPTN